MKVFEGFTQQAQELMASEMLEDYNKVNFYGTIFSALLVLHLAAKLVFNIFVDIKLPIDKWTAIDLVSSVFNIVCFNMIGKTDPATIVDRDKKMTLDYYVIAVVIVGWLRFFGYFLVIRSVSKLLSTLIKMIADAVSFILIVSSYLLLMASIFTILFQSAIPDAYGSMVLSLRSLFDGMLGGYNYTDDDAYMVSCSILTMVHVFISNIFLLNFLVAILSTVYEIMMEHGEFSFKSNKYQFIEKYSLPLMDQHGYAELVIHPSPLNAFSVFLLPFTFRSHFMKRPAEIFSKAMFWLENVLFYLLVFVLKELALCPWVYLKVFVVVAVQAPWARLVPLFFCWAFIGPLVLLFHVAQDTFLYVKLLCDYMDEED